MPPQMSQTADRWAELPLLRLSARIISLLVVPALGIVGYAGVALFQLQQTVAEQNVRVANLDVRLDTAIKDMVLPRVISLEADVRRLDRYNRERQASGFGAADAALMKRGLLREIDRLERIMEKNHSGAPLPDANPR